MTARGPKGGLQPEREVLLMAREVARRCSVHQRTVRRWIKNGWLPVVRFGAAVRIRPSDLDAFIRDQLS